MYDDQNIKNYDFACSLVVQLEYQKKKTYLVMAELVTNHVSNSGQWWNMPKRFSSIITHYFNSSVWRTAQKTQRNTHSYCSIYTQKNYHCYRHQTEDVGDSLRNYCMAFIGTMDENVLKIKILFRNIFPPTGNWKYVVC